MEIVKDSRNNINAIKQLARAICAIENDRYVIINVSNPSIINLAGEIERLAEEIQNDTTD